MMLFAIERGIACVTRQALIECYSSDSDLYDIIVESFNDIQSSDVCLERCLELDCFFWTGSIVNLCCGLSGAS
jgi:hypothetical protein